MADVIVVGGGLVGLATAVFLARRGQEVTVVERDGPPPEVSSQGLAGAELDAAEWARPGAPQCHQSHVLLGRARRVLLDEAPDVLEALRARGVGEQAATVGAGEAPGEMMLLGRRLVVEGVLRRAAEREPGVTIRSGEAVEALRARVGDAPVVDGVRTSTGEVLAADVVVDAGGRRSALPRWLADLGARPAVDEAQPLGFFYLTRYYRLRPGAVAPVMKVPGSVPLDYANVLAFRGDNDTFSLSITMSVADPHRQALRDPERHHRFLEAVPMSAPWLAVGDPIGEISMLARLENRRRRLVDDAGPIVEGLVPIGDASLHTNPTLGRGTAMGFAQAQHLADTLAAPHDPADLVRGFDEWTQQHLGIWFDTQVAADASIEERLAAGVRGERLPTSPDPRVRQLAGAFACAQTDPVVAGAVAQVVHLLASPIEVLGRPEVARRVQAYLATDPDLERPPDRPSRAEFEAIVAG